MYIDLFIIQNLIYDYLILNGVANIPATVNKEERKKLQAKRELLLDMIMLKGFYNEENGKLYRVVAQSASQQRLGKYIFTSQNWEEVRTKMLYGYDFGKEFVRTTKEARCGLAFTSALLVKDFHPSISLSTVDFSCSASLLLASNFARSSPYLEMTSHSISLAEYHLLAATLAGFTWSRIIILFLAIQSS